MSCSGPKEGLRENNIEVRIAVQTLWPTIARTSLSERFEPLSSGGRRDTSVKTCSAISKGKSGSDGMCSGFAAILRIRSGLGEGCIDMLPVVPQAANNQALGCVSI
jgi:hypothetical protein